MRDDVPLLNHDKLTIRFLRIYSVAVLGPELMVCYLILFWYAKCQQIGKKRRWVIISSVKTEYVWACIRFTTVAVSIFQTGISVLSDFSWYICDFQPLVQWVPVFVGLKRP